MRRFWIAALLVCAGCSFFSKSKSRYYSLDRVAPAARATFRGVPIGIDTLAIPAGLDRKEVAVRTAGHQLDVRGGDQWAASFQTLVLDTLANDLAARLPDGMVVFPGQQKPAAMRSIDIVFEELAAGPTNTVVLDVQWIVHEAGRADVAHHEQLSADIPSLDSANVASGVSQVLATFADKIVAGLPSS